MNAKALIPLGVAIVLGGIAAKVGRDMLARKETKVMVTVNMSRVIVAKENIAAGTALRGDHLLANPVAESALPPGSFRDPISLNNRVVTMPVMKGQPILENMLAPEGTSKGLTAIVPDGMRAVSLEVNEVSGVAGMLVPGCRIDIVCTLSSEGGQMVARTIARNLQIVAVGKRFADAVGSNGGKDGAKEEPADQQVPARTVTLLVTPREAQLIDLAGHTGTTRLVLRGSRDTRADLTADVGGVTLAELRGSSSDRSGFGQIFNRFVENISKLPPAPVRTASAEPTTQPAKNMNVRQVTVIRNTKEQAVQVEARTPALDASRLASPDVGDAIKSGN